MKDIFLVLVTMFALNSVVYCSELGDNNALWNNKLNQKFFIAKMPDEITENNKIDISNMATECPATVQQNFDESSVKSGVVLKLRELVNENRNIHGAKAHGHEIEDESDLSRRYSSDNRILNDADKELTLLIYELLKKDNVRLVQMLHAQDHTKYRDAATFDGLPPYKPANKSKDSSQIKKYLNDAIKSMSHELPLKDPYSPNRYGCPAQQELEMLCKKIKGLQESDKKIIDFVLILVKLGNLSIKESKKAYINYYLWCKKLDIWSQNLESRGIKSSNQDLVLGLLSKSRDLQDAYGSNLFFDEAVLVLKYMIQFGSTKGADYIINTTHEDSKSMMDLDKLLDCQNKSAVLSVENSKQQAGGGAAASSDRITSNSGVPGPGAGAVSSAQ